jgi:hypothetical protein
MFQYCVLIVEGKLFSSKNDVQIDLGDEGNLAKYDATIIERTKKVYQRDSLIDALNYLGELGWELAHVTAPKAIGGTDNGPETRYLLKRSY